MSQAAKFALYQQFCDKQIESSTVDTLFRQFDFGDPEHDRLLDHSYRLYMEVKELEESLKRPKQRFSIPAEHLLDLSFPAES